eukprot:SAG31_NODE_105_length_25008_cov_17.439399_4_plen_82_part_00
MCYKKWLATDADSRDDLVALREARVAEELTIAEHQVCKEPQPELEPSSEIATQPAYCALKIEYGAMSTASLELAMLLPRVI